MGTDKKIIIICWVSNFVANGDRLASSFAVVSRSWRTVLSHFHGEFSCHHNCGYNAPHRGAAVFDVLPTQYRRCWNKRASSASGQTGLPV
jgi:hypothetical protein